MPRKGAKAPGAEVGLSGSSVTVVSGSIRTPDESDALAVKLSIWATEVTMRADGAELGNWEVSEVAVRAIDSTSFEFIAEGDQLIFTPDDPMAFSASGLVAGRTGSSGRKSRKAKKMKPEPARASDAQGHSAPSDGRRGKRRATEEAASPKLSRRERKAAERAAAELAEAPGIGVEGPGVGTSIRSDPEGGAASKRRMTVRAAAVPTPIGEGKAPSRDIAEEAIAEAAIAETTSAEDATAPAITVNRTAMAETSTITPNGISNSPVTDRIITDRPTGEDYAGREPSHIVVPLTRGVEAAPVEPPPQEPRPKKARRGRGRGRREASFEESLDSAPDGPAVSTPMRDEAALTEAALDDLEEPDAGKATRIWIRALDVARKYDFLGLDRVPVNESLRGQDHQHTWDHRVAPASGLGKHICTICGEIRR